MQSSDWSWNTTWYLTHGGKSTVLVWKQRKKYLEEILGSEPEYKLKVILVFSLFEPRDSYKNNSYKKDTVHVLLFFFVCRCWAYLLVQNILISEVTDSWSSAIKSRN